MRLYEEPKTLGQISCASSRGIVLTRIHSLCEPLEKYCAERIMLAEEDLLQPRQLQQRQQEGDAGFGRRQLRKPLPHPW